MRQCACGFAIRDNVLNRTPGGLKLEPFDPRKSKGPAREDQIHLNNICMRAGELWLSGYNFRHLYMLRGGAITRGRRIPPETHNSRPYRDGVLMCSTGRDELLHLAANGDRAGAVPAIRYDAAKLVNTHIESKAARQGFMRGLAEWGENHVLVGSSPATVALVDTRTWEIARAINISMDLRNAIHGLEVFPWPDSAARFLSSAA